MKNGKWIVPLVAGAGAAAIAYGLLTKKSIPDTASVQPFDLSRYMGSWNEIARLPNLLEKKVDKLIEVYTLNTDGTFSVITKTFNAKKNKWSNFNGTGKFAGYQKTGKLQVSYLGPLYLDYNVLGIDADYKHALVSGSGLNYLWILSKDIDVPDDIKTRFIATARALGFDVDKLEWV